MITDTQLAKLHDMIQSGNLDAFYAWTAWRKLKEEVRKQDNYECQHCKRKGRYRRGYIVHHIKHVKDRPDLALSTYDPETGDKQLELVCFECHQEEHPEQQRRYKPKEKPLTVERWD